jgi:hypothetical protein
MIDHTATAKRRGSKLVKGEYVVVTRSDNFCTNNFKNGYVYRVRECHDYLRVEKDNSGVPNSAPYIQIEDIRPATTEEIAGYIANNDRPYSSALANFKVNARYGAIRGSEMIKACRGVIARDGRILPIPDGILDNADSRIDIKSNGDVIITEKSKHQKAQVFKKRAKTKRKLIIK